jgi:hypothetical protein
VTQGTGNSDTIAGKQTKKKKVRTVIQHNQRFNVFNQTTKNFKKVGGN